MKFDYKFDQSYERAVIDDVIELQVPIWSMFSSASRR